MPSRQQKSTVRPSLRIALLLVLSLAVAVLLLAVLQPSQFREFDPALSAPDPGALRGDEWDRDAAAVLEQSRGIAIASDLADPSRDLDVMTRVFESRDRHGDERWLVRRGSARAVDVLAIRRPRAAYEVVSTGLTAPARDARLWAIRVLVLLEARLAPMRGEERVDPPYVGPERDSALERFGQLCFTEPDIEIRRVAVNAAMWKLPGPGIPANADLLSAIARETDQELKVTLLWLVALRGAVAAKTVLDASLRGFEDPVSVSTAIREHFVEENLGLIETAFDRGDPVSAILAADTPAIERFKRDRRDALLY